MEHVPLLIEFAPHTFLYRERDVVSQLPIIRNGPAGTFVVFPDGLRVSLPTDQIIFADDTGGYARVGLAACSSPDRKRDAWCSYGFASCSRRISSRPLGVIRCCSIRSGSPQLP